MAAARLQLVGLRLTDTTGPVPSSPDITLVGLFSGPPPEPTTMGFESKKERLVRQWHLKVKTNASRRVALNPFRSLQPFVRFVRQPEEREALLLQGLGHGLPQECAEQQLLVQ